MSQLTDYLNTLNPSSTQLKDFDRALVVLWHRRLGNTSPHSGTTTHSH